MSKPTGKPNGRPTLYSEELAARICQELASGKSLRTVCAVEEMPNMSTIFLWIAKHDEFSKQYARATEERAEAYVEEIFEIADDARNDFMEDQYLKGKTPGYQLNGENIQRSKLRVDTRKWYASKVKPKKYGEKLDIKAESEITHKFEDLSDDELERAIKAKQDRAA